MAHAAAPPMHPVWTRGEPHPSAGPSISAATESASAVIPAPRSQPPFAQAAHQPRPKWSGEMVASLRPVEALPRQAMARRPQCGDVQPELSKPVYASR